MENSDNIARGKNNLFPSYEFIIINTYFSNLKKWGGTTQALEKRNRFI